MKLIRHGYKRPKSAGNGRFFARLVAFKARNCVSALLILNNKQTDEEKRGY